MTTDDTRVTVQRTIDASMAWTARLLNGQKKTDYRPRDDANLQLDQLQTPTCQSIFAFLHRLHTRAAAANPALLAIKGVGPVIGAQLLITAGDNPDRITSEAAFAHLCGAAPIPASSGRTHRHRLNRGGDRQANRALHMILLTRLRQDPETRAYVQRSIDRGKSKRDAMRALKNYIARRLHRVLCDTVLNPHIAT